MTSSQAAGTDNCPTCGQKLPSDLPLHVDLEVNVVVANGVAVALTGKQAELLALIASTGVRVATYEFLIQGLYLQEEAEIDILKVMVCKMRQKLVKAGVGIDTIWGKGFRLSLKNERQLSA